jgi:hypothetical protein
MTGSTVFRTGASAAGEPDGMGKLINHCEHKGHRGVRQHKIPIVVTFLASIGLISEGAAQQEASPYTRLILPAENATPQYDLLKFTNAKEACDFYGAIRKECKLAKEYFAGWGGSYTATLEFARFPTESTRAHLYGGGVVARSTPAELAAKLDAGTTLNVPLNGVTLTACFGTGAGCKNLAGLTTYDEIASAVESALNASPVTLGTITGTITPSSVAINITIEREKTAFLVNSVGGTLYTGTYVCEKSNPCLSRSRSDHDLIGQIANQMIWAPETVRDGPGWYGWLGDPDDAGFQMPHPKETINAIASYGLLTVTSYDSGSQIAAPMGINSGGVPIGYLWECISLCGQVGAQWVVNNAATVSTPETMNLTSVRVVVLWNGRTNGSTTWGFFDIQQEPDAQPILVNTTGYATGSAATILGLSKGSRGYPGVLYSGAFASSPGNTVRSIGAWLDHFRASVDSSWTSCEIDYSSPNVPDTLANEIQDWATKHPPIQCPASWVTNPPSTPSLISCIDHDPSCPPQ